MDTAVPQLPKSREQTSMSWSQASSLAKEYVIEPALGLAEQIGFQDQTTSKSGWSPFAKAASARLHKSQSSSSVATALPMT